MFMSKNVQNLEESLTQNIEEYIFLQEQYNTEHPDSIDDLNQFKNEFGSIRDQIIQIRQDLYFFLAKQSLSQTNKKYIYTQIEKSHIHIEILTYSLINPIIQQINEIRINTAIEKIDVAIDQEKILIKSSKNSIITAWIIFILSVVVSFVISYYLSDRSFCFYQSVCPEKIPSSSIVDTNYINKIFNRISIFYLNEKRFYN